jgi:hypothetical protein
LFELFPNSWGCTKKQEIYMQGTKIDCILEFFFLLRLDAQESVIINM